jgi:hypothetical protein
MLAASMKTVTGDPKLALAAGAVILATVAGAVLFVIESSTGESIQDEVPEQTRPLLEGANESLQSAQEAIDRVSRRAEAVCVEEAGSPQATRACLGR